MVAGTRVKFWFSICKARAMHIKEFLAIDAVEQADGDLDQDVTGLAYDSRKAGAGQIFFAVPGEKVDGHDFIADAVRRARVQPSCSRARAIGRARPPLCASKIRAARWPCGRRIFSTGRAQN